MGCLERGEREIIDGKGGRRVYDWSFCVLGFLCGVCDVCDVCDVCCLMFDV